MKTYYLILRDDPEILARLSPSDMQGVVQRYVKWREDNSKFVTGGEKLVDGRGRVVRRQGDALSVSDGPFMEAKEVLGGFFVVNAENDEGAEVVAATCPHLEFGSIEIRQLEPTD